MKVYKDQHGTLSEWKDDLATLRQSEFAKIAARKGPSPSEVRRAAQAMPPSRAATPRASLARDPAEQVKLIDTELARLRKRVAAIAVARNTRIRNNQLAVFTPGETQELQWLLKRAKTLNRQRVRARVLALEVRRFIRTDLVDVHRAERIAMFLRAYGLTDAQIARYDKLRRFRAKVQVEAWRRKHGI